MSSYEYQPGKRLDAFDEGVLTLLSKGHVATTHCPSLGAIDEIQGRVAAQDVKTKELVLDVNGYHRSCLEAGYRSRYPEYYTANFPEKSLEHFVALTLLDLNGADIVLDLASEHSPLYEIFNRLYGADTFSQDIMFEKGIHGHKIGSDACAMPLPDGFATKAVLTCSLEHFEGNADTRLFWELRRVLRPGGMLCVVPLYLASSAFTMTDPTISAVNDVSFDQGSILYCRKGWGSRHGRFYSPVLPLSDYRARCFRYGREANGQRREWTHGAGLPLVERAAERSRAPTRQVAQGIPRQKGLRCQENS